MKDVSREISKDLLKEVLQGSLDFHIHVAPDVEKKRIGDAYDLTLQAKESGMRGIVIKSHDYPTAPLAHLINRVIGGIEVVGGIALNTGVGGLNPDAVEVSAKLGAKVVWMPTNSSRAARRRKGLEQGIFILGEKGNVLPEVKEILSLVKQFDLVLCTGHLSKEEIFPLQDEALKMGIARFVLTHPLKGGGGPIDLKAQKEIAEKGAIVEHCFLATLSLSGRLDPSEIVEAIRLVGAERCLLSTDFGQLYNPPPSEGMRMMIATMLECGLSEKELALLVKENPCRLLNL